MDKKFLTTPIYYVNDIPHIGHAYTTIITDTLARYFRLVGHETFFLTGTDEHGQKIEQAASLRGKKPKEYADEISSKFKSLWDEFDISYDYFIRTTDQSHMLTAQKVFEKMFNKGDIYKGEYEGFYCISCESFFPQSQLINNDCCPDCGKKTSLVKEESYFFKLSKYENRLLQWYESDNCIIPKSKKNEVISFVKQGLKDLSVTRTSFSWGIRLPDSINDPKHVIYVWLDALVNYLSALGYLNGDDKMDFWPANFHLVGKDILRFHAVYWPAFLMSLELPLPNTIAAHGWWTRDGNKMSKSLGNVVNPKEIARTYGLEQFRYFLLREVPFGQDGDFSEKSLIDRVNSELCNDLGNLLNRIIGMSKNYSNFEISSKDVLKFHSAEIEQAKEHLRVAETELNNVATNRYLEELWKVLNLANASIAKYEPWLKVKNGKVDEALAVVAMVANLLAKVAILISPAMPKSAEKIAKSLGFSIDTTAYNRLIKENGLIDMVCMPSEVLFNKLEPLQESNETSKEPKIEQITPKIKIDDFKKCEIKVGTIVECENIQGSEKLLRFMIDLGENKNRQIISGVAKFYNPNELVGKQVCVLSNLKPAKIFGHVSEGMILSAADSSLVLLSTLKPVSNGSLVG